ncbi:hypothetical protein ACFU2J_07735 [Streptomyces sp. NPDC057387]|uniref:hypothetical protein n=1 Tax=Streptomyces sp. NPDC057387 TaxID=3346115 RepID=UPI003640D817
MSHIEELLSRALLVRNRTVPREPAPHPTTPATGQHPPTPTPAHRPAHNGTVDAAAEDLRALCETLLTHTPPAAVADFLTDQVPEPRSALALACVLQLSDTDEGARFWWQYAAGAGQVAAAYCLYLHHLAQGEGDTADWWHHQADDVSPPPGTPDPDQDIDTVSCAGHWHPANHSLTSTSTATILRVLRRLSQNTARPRSAAVRRLMAYIPDAVAAGYLREPETELPLPGAGFAQRVQALITASATRPAKGEPPTRPATRESTETTPRAAGGAAKR